ncbi:alpha/beta hydrolase [Pseudomonas sp. MWU16-30317]|uniref:alpha/beta hydrolase n=1 Tax=Pseudomonas sp. MWU16-30317 TaxID=2878095 RepID=UPI001CFBF059|nr:alpha/beta hydrolase [Pseudomonas sp. MWU16-30317]
MRKPIMLALAVSAVFNSVAFAATSPSALEACLATQAPTDPQDEVQLFRQLQIKGPQMMSGVQRIYYGKNLDQYGDLRLPAGKGPFPVVIIVHGGLWMSSVNSDYMAPIAQMLTEAGYATWNIEYSRIGSGGEWPGSFNSVGAAADYVKVLAEKYPLKIDEVLAVGHSSGGHYALWLAGRHKIKPGAMLYSEHPLPLKGVISLDGTPDIEAFAGLPRGKVIIPKLLGNGTNTEMSERYSQASPAQLLPLGVQQFFITEQSDRWPSMSAYITKGQGMGDKIGYQMLCPANHFTTTDSGNSQVRQLILDTAKSMVK